MALPSLCVYVALAAAAVTPAEQRALAEQKAPATCAEGSLAACHADAVASYFAGGDAKSRESALSALKDVCGRGYEAACKTVEKLERVSAPPASEQTGVAPRPSRRDLKTRLTEGCEGGDSKQCYDLALRHERGSSLFEKDPARAQELLQKACDGTSGAACRKLGQTYLKGKTAKAALVRAVELDGASCEGGELPACWRQGHAYLRGEGVKMDLKRAKKVLEDACAKKEAWSCTSLGDMFHHGDGVNRNRKAAYEYYAQGCELGAGHGCYGAGLVLDALYRERQVGEKEMAAGAAAYEQACDKGYPSGCWMLAALFDEGRGVPKDREKSKQLLALACQKGHTLACKGRLPERDQPGDDGSFAPWTPPLESY